MNGLTLSYVKLRFSPQISFKALIYTGACANVIPKQTFHELRQNRDIEKLLHIENTTLSTVKMASGSMYPWIPKYQYRSNLEINALMRSFWSSNLQTL